MDSKSGWRPGGKPPVSEVEAMAERLRATREGRTPAPAPVSAQPTAAETDRYTPRSRGRPSLADVDAAHARIVAKREGRPVSPADQPAPTVDLSKFEARPGGKPTVAEVEEFLARRQAARA